LTWVKSLIVRVKTEDVEGLRSIRLGIGLAKELMQEALPIGLFASRYFQDSDKVEIALKLGSQSYDATVRDFRASPSGIAYLEVTMATEGETDYRRMQTLQETGHVSGLGPITTKGTERSGQLIKIAAVMVSQQEVLEKERKIISEAIERKLHKTYPAHTALIIVFDDTMSFDRKDNIANIENVLERFGPRLDVFHTVAIVGLQKLLICRPSVNAF
jgi:hypothetical protein